MKWLNYKVYWVGPPGHATRPVDALLVTGSRNIPEDPLFAKLVEQDLTFLKKDGLLVHGGARGLDILAGELWPGKKSVHLPDYDAFEGRAKKAAPLARNGSMVTLLSGMQLAERTVRVSAYHFDAEDRGTLDCMRKAFKANLPVTVFDLVGNLEEEIRAEQNRRAQLVL